MSLGTNEWYTRPQYIEAARAVMGSIELDPASCAAANEIVKAERYFTKEQNGILQEWRARSLWLNPPYGRSGKMVGMHQSSIKMFVDKCLAAYQRGDVLQAIILATTEVNAKWFYPLWQYPICIPDHRVNFIVPVQQKNKYSQMFGTCFAYLGPNTDKFTKVFSKFGRIVRAIDTPKPRPIARELWTEAAAFCASPAASSQAGSGHTDRYLVVSGDDARLLTTGGTGAEVNCEVCK